LILPLGQGQRKRTFLLKTGQSTSYVDHDDGYYEKGIAKAYTILTAGQYLGTTAITINGKTDTHSNNCVIDNNTGLMWSRYPSAGVGAASDGKLPFTVNVNGEGIFEYCAAANAASLGGHTDWRIPNVFELFTLLDQEAADSNPDSTAFPTYAYITPYTCTTYTSNTANALAVGFFAGGTNQYAKTSDRSLVLVRG
jgi:hypothetical protein